MQLPSASGDFQPDSPKREIAARKWNPGNVYWILDVNQKRYIVKAFYAKGVGNRFLYRAWKSPTEGFSRTALAMTCPKYPPKDPATLYIFKRDLSGSDTKNASVKRRRGIQNTSTKPLPCPQTPNEVLSLSSNHKRLWPSTDKGDDESQLDRGASDTLLALKPTPRLYPSSPTVAFTANDLSKRWGLSTQPQTPIAAPSYASSPTTTFTNSGRSKAWEFSTQSETPTAALSLHKLNNTILFIALPSSSDVIPLKLRSCATMDSFFNSVRSLCGHTEEDIHVTGLRIRHEWKDDRDPEKTVLLKESCADGFEIFLETIDKAPCWEEGGGGRCHVSIEVLGRVTSHWPPPQWMPAMWPQASSGAKLIPRPKDSKPAWDFTPGPRQNQPKNAQICHGLPLC